MRRFGPETEPLEERDGGSGRTEHHMRAPAVGRPRGLLQIAALMDRYSPEIAAPGIPLAVQRPLWRALAATGRKPASFPEYGAP